MPPFRRAGKGVGGLSKLRCVLIGVGRRSLDDYVPALAELADQIELAAACDVDVTAEARLAATLADLGYRATPAFYSRYESAIDEIAPDLAVVATPHHTHLEVARSLIARGIPFLKEKPFALSLPQAYELTDLLHENAGHMRLAVQRRYHPLYICARTMLPRIGAARHYDATYQLHTDGYRAGWRAHTATAGGGAIIDMGYHLLDLLHWFFGPPSLVYATAAPKLVPAAAYDIEETVLSTLTYDSGLTGTLRLSLCEASKEELVRVHGTAGHLRLTRRSLELFDRSDNLLERMTAESAWSSAAGVLTATIADLADPAVARREVLDGVAITATIEALYRSIAQQTSVKLVTPKDIRNARFGPRYRRRLARARPEHDVPMAEAAARLA
jgi:predicted dehydrogenase